MKRITIERPKVIPDEPLYLDRVSENTPIFAKWGDRIKGMVIKEGAGWVLRTGGSNRGYCGHYRGRTELLHELETRYSLTLHVEEK